MAKVSLRVYNQEIETMIDRSQLDEAVAHCKHILKTFPKHLETYRLLGKAFLEYKRFPDAADIFSRVLVAAPDDFVANVGMSIIRDEANRLDEAIWHMERAFETQPSNAAIQSELQRLYGRREGVQPPRIRMTRGALAHMYVQGELYPQAISEIKGVLKDDPGRTDMQVLLARAYYKSGLKNDAAEVASAVLRNNPYCLDANRVLVEILGVDHPESVQAYRQRVVELDPYAAQVTSSVFSSDEVPNMAVTLERLDWNGQPVSMQPDWEATQAISLEGSQRPEEQPDWLRSNFGETSAPSQPTSLGESLPSAPVFDAAAPSAQPPEPVEDIPDFLRAAGWGQATGAFDESKSVFADEEPASAAQPIEQGDLPDWVKAMAPPPAETPTEAEEMPDWINKIGSSALPGSSEPSSAPDWLKTSEPPAAQPADEQPDWLNEFSASQGSAPAASEDQPDWLRSFASETDAAPSAAPTNDLDWLNQLDETVASKPAEPGGAEADFRKSFASQPEATPGASDDDLSWLGQLGDTVESKPGEPASSESDFFKSLTGQPEAAPSAAPDDDLSWLGQLGETAESKPGEPASVQPAPATEEFDFLNELTADAGQLAPAATPGTPAAESLGMSSAEQDDSFAWLENLAAKQGATEGLLTQPEERLQEEPDWIKQVKGADAGQPAATEPPVEQPPAEQPPVAQPAANLEELGKSEQEQDDSFAWLEGLAAKQGATEGLLTKPEERLEKEPEWVQQAKTLGEQPEVPQEQEPPVTEPVASLEELGKSEQEQDDSFAWLESLAAKQGATEGLLTKPEERLHEEPDWVKQAKEVEAQQPPAPAPVPESLISAVDDTAAWLRNLDEEEAAAVPETPSMDETAVWLKNLDEPEKVQPEPVEAAPADDLPAWMQNLGESEGQVPAGEPLISETLPEAAETSEWMSAIPPEQPAVQPPPKVDTGSLPSWLRGLDEEKQVPAATDEGLPAWLRDETGEVVAEPPKIEPTRSSDWQPVEAKQPEPEPKEPEPVPAPPPVEVKPSVPEAPAAPPQPEPAVVAQEKPKKLTGSLRPAKEPARRVPETPSSLDPVLGQARGELSRSNIPGALENYGRLIKKGRYLEDVIYDLREALYRYPVEVSIWQSLGDAYMRANRLQDALDSYTKAEELLR
jgi:tetratricopeptide (TPR) repeat protein